MSTLKSCPFCGGEAYLHDRRSDGYSVRCLECSATLDKSRREEAISAWNRRAGQPAPAPEPWAWLCNGKGDGWEERDKVVRDQSLIARYREQPDRWRIEPLYLHSPAPAPEGWVDALKTEGRDE